MTKKRKSNPHLVCPYECGGRKYKSVNKRRTRCCDREIVRVNGGIYSHLDAAPEWVLIKEFETRKRKTDPHYSIEYGDREEYPIAVKMARSLYSRCDQDLDFAKKVIEVTFTHPAHRWRDMHGFWSILSKKLFPDAKAKARIALAKERKANELQRSRLASVAPRLETSYATGQLL